MSTPEKQPLTGGAERYRVTAGATEGSDSQLEPEGAGRNTHVRQSVDFELPNTPPRRSAPDHGAPQELFSPHTTQPPLLLPCVSPWGRSTRGPLA